MNPRIYFSITAFMLNPLLFCAMSKETSWRKKTQIALSYSFVNIPYIEYVKLWDVYSV